MLTHLFFSKANAQDSSNYGKYSIAGEKVFFFLKMNRRTPPPLKKKITKYSEIKNINKGTNGPISPKFAYIASLGKGI